ncbi:glycosyltransferase BC10 [Salvia miltiorrhiza]|uniref:glycosyltransferase BC10 n=1 Tax=Salvia miltiorrhiza TaxID=226208 RepID=UPI0025ABABCF|nr:glycosyltransferase BC10 [Salvia miltiorrhiza]
MMLKRHSLADRLFQLFLFAVGVSVGAVSILCLRSFSFAIPSIPFSTLKSSSPVLLETRDVSLKLMMHNMSDAELLARVGNTTSYKVAFMFLTPGPLPLAPVWDRFFKGHQGLYSVYVHPHPSYNHSAPPHSAFYGRTIPTQAVYWGTITMIDAERRLLANALLDSSNQRFVLLSDSCIPVFNFTTIYNYLMGTNKSFIGSFDDPRKMGRGRYNHHMWPNITIEQWRKGSQWFEVHRDLAVKIVSDQKYYSLFREFCHPPCYNDEHYLPTLINILYSDSNSNRTITWVDWSRGGPHPRKFGWIDVKPDLLNYIRFGSECIYNGNTTNLCNLFARKFLPNTVGPLLKLATWLLGFDP